MSYLHHTGQLARFNNILGKDTIRTLERLTSRITIVFTHSTMVDRIAAMLNYFLLNLVGPNKKNFKVNLCKHELKDEQVVADIGNGEVGLGSKKKLDHCLVSVVYFRNSRFSGKKTDCCLCLLTG